MTLRDDLRPTGRNRVYDLVQAAGVDVSDWANFKRGVKGAAANPKYCYEWSFVEPGRVVVLNLWHANIAEVRGVISARFNMREIARIPVAASAKPLWLKRAGKMDEAIQTARREGLLLRVILNEGSMRAEDDPEGGPSHVSSRLLDPIPWAIKRYDVTTGDCLLVRGGESIPSVDQFADEFLSPNGPRLVVVPEGVAFVRDAAVRAAALKRANGHCEFCGQPGFATRGEKLFLETHHIVPLSEGGTDVLENVAGVCPNHHREAHFGAMADLIRAQLLEVASRGTGKDRKRTT